MHCEARLPDPAGAARRIVYLARVAEAPARQQIATCSLYDPKPVEPALVPIIIFYFFLLGFSIILAFRGQSESEIHELKF